LEYFTKCLVKQKLAKADNNLNKKEWL
jgi:hypothetical protein